MAIITDTDFNNILTEHGVTATLRIKDETPLSPTRSRFDMIYGSPILGGNAGGPGNYISRPLFCLFQYVTGDEQWIGSVGTLTTGDAMIFTRSMYTQGSVTYAPQVGNWIAYNNQTYEVTAVMPNQTAGNVIFLEVHAKHTSAQS